MMLHSLILETKKLLQNIDGWLDKANAHATAKGYDANVLLQARLAPDMFPLVRQIQSACDSAKFAATHAAGKAPPSHPDNEQSLDEVRKRIRTMVTFLDGFKSSDFEGAESRKVSMPRWEGKSMPATDYVVEHAMPNFFFHYTTAYAILRHNGVDIGKRDYLGQVSYR